MPRHTSKGFTLIELLVVISIIALLISILLPALRAARESGRTVQCLSGQRQVAMSMHVYHADEGTFPPYFFSGAVYPGKWAGYAWSAALWKQNILPGATELLICPSFDEGVRLPDTTLPEATSMNFTHFGYNYHYVGGTTWGEDGNIMPNVAYWRVIPPSEADFAKPSDTYMIMDTIARATTALGVTQGGYVVNSAKASSQTFVPWARHGTAREVLTMAFVDGHATSIILRDRLLPYDDVGVRTDVDNKWDRN